MPRTRKPPGMDSELKKLKEQKVLSFLSESFTMAEFAHRCRSCDVEIEINPFDVWEGHAEDVYLGCIAREKDYYRSSIGLTYKSPAKEIDDFDEKGWILRRNPGPYNDYERLYVGNIIFCDGELIGEYYNLFLSYDADLALRKCYKLLRSSITWETSWSAARRIANDAITETERQHIVPNLLTKVIKETLNLKISEQEKKERVPIYIKVFQEVVREKRDFKEVMIEIKENDAASFPLYTDIIEGKLRRGENLESMGLKYAIDDVEKYINAVTKGEQSEEELIPRYCRENDLSVHTYADYLEKKIQMAVKLRIITNIGNNNSCHNNSCLVFQNHAL
ncbi:uncharacterized protein LOC144563364 isoform X2 [Carex rostrata]